MAENERQTGGEVLERTKQQTIRPEMFKVLLLNDDYTTMDFVIETLLKAWTGRPFDYRGQMVGNILNARGGQGGYVNAIACPDGIRSYGGSCNTGIDKAGSGLALITQPR